MTGSLIVGIDPGVETGFAIWSLADKRLQLVTSMGIVAAMVKVASMRDCRTLHSVVYEDARLRTWFGAKGVEALQGAGSIKRDCSVWAEWLEFVGCPYKQISPAAKGAKLTAEQFQRVTGWTARTNNHGRDAAMCVFGMRG